MHIDWLGATHLVGRLQTTKRSAAVTFEYACEWLARIGAFSIDPTGLPLGPSLIHAASLLGALQDCGPDRWGRIRIERAVRKLNDGRLALAKFRKSDDVRDIAGCEARPSPCKTGGDQRR